MSWQDVVAIGVVLGACGYLLSLAWGGLAGRSSDCGSGCGKCGAADAKLGTETALVSIGGLGGPAQAEPARAITK